MGKIEELKTSNYVSIEGNIGKHEVQLVTISTCIWCRRIKQKLNDNGIAYGYTDIDNLPYDERIELKEFLRRYQRNLAFPMVFCDGNLVKGMRQDEIIDMLKH
ncbi:MAG: glutaredoxin domain-containing protein [Candidatus Helarchaeota archaeon]